MWLLVWRLNRAAMDFNVARIDGSWKRYAMPHEENRNVTSSEKSAPVAASAESTKSRREPS